MKILTTLYAAILIAGMLYALCGMFTFSQQRKQTTFTITKIDSLVRLEGPGKDYALYADSCRCLLHVGAGKAKEDYTPSDDSFISRCFTKDGRNKQLTNETEVLSSMPDSLR